MSEREFLESRSSSVFEKIIVARTLATWYAPDGAVTVQIENPSSDGVALPIGLFLDQLFTVSVVTPDQLHLNAGAKTPKSVDELAQAKSELERPLSKAEILCHRFVRTVPSCLCLVNVRVWSLDQCGSNISFAP